MELVVKHIAFLKDVFIYTNGQTGEGSRWRLCYQRGYPIEFIMAKFIKMALDLKVNKELWQQQQTYPMINQKKIYYEFSLEKQIIFSWP